MKTESKCTNRWIRTWRVHVCHCASISYMLLQQKVRHSVPRTRWYPVWVIRKIHGSVLDSLIISCFVVHIIKHSVLPVGPWSSTEGARGLGSFELASVMSILDKELEMSIRMHMNDNGSIVDNIMIKILQILFPEPQFLNSFLYPSLIHKMKFLTFLVHVYHRLNLKTRASFEWFVLLPVVKDFSRWTSLYVLVVLVVK